MVLRNTIIVGLANIALNFIFIPIWSYDGASFTTVISEIMIMTMDAWSAKDIIKPIIFSKAFLKNILSSLIGCLGIVLICWLCDISYVSVTLKTVFSVCLSVPMYFAILIVLNNKVALHLVKYIRIKH